MDYNNSSKKKLNIWVPKELYEDLEEWAEVSHKSNVSDAAREALYFYFEDRKGIEAKKAIVEVILTGYNLQLKHKQEQEDKKAAKEKREQEDNQKKEEQVKEKGELTQTLNELKPIYQEIYNKIGKLPEENLKESLETELSNLHISDYKKELVKSKVINFICKMRALNKSIFEGEDVS